MSNEFENYVTNDISNKYTIKTILRNKFCKNFNHLISSPPVEDLNYLESKMKTYFNFNKIIRGGYITLPSQQQSGVTNYYIDFYKTFGKPYIYGLYNRDVENNKDIIIGAITLVFRHDYNIWQIMDMKVLPDYRKQGSVGTFIRGTFFKRMSKTTSYYIICFDDNKIIDKIINNSIIPNMIDRGKMYIYLITHEQMNDIITILEYFYDSQIGFINNENLRVIANFNNNQSYKILHLNHNNSNSNRHIDISTISTDNLYKYCFSIHESNNYVIEKLKDEYNIDYSSTATIYSNNFITDWSKFVKTYEI
jgi:hypothetical protein